VRRNNSTPEKGAFTVRRFSSQVVCKSGDNAGGQLQKLRLQVKRNLTDLQ